MEAAPQPLHERVLELEAEKVGLEARVLGLEAERSIVVERARN